MAIWKFTNACPMTLDNEENDFLHENQGFIPFLFP